jgi:hypothetical protein
MVGTWVFEKLQKKYKVYKKLIYLAVVGLGITYFLSAITLAVDKLWLIVIG